MPQPIGRLDEKLRHHLLRPQTAHRLAGVEDEQRHHDRARPVRNLAQVKEKPAGEQHDLHRHGGDGAPGDLSEQRQGNAGKDVHPGGAAQAEDEQPGADHVRRVGRIAGDLESEIRLDRGTQIGDSRFVERPAAVGLLPLPQIVGETVFQVGIDRPPEEALQQEIFRRDGNIGLQIEDPIAFRMLQGKEILQGTVNALRKEIAALQVPFAAHELDRPARLDAGCGGFDRRPDLR